jgi:hypothetical protein
MEQSKYMELNNMIRPIITIHNTETNEIIEREMNDAEFAQYEIDMANAIAEKAETDAKAAAKAAVLAQLGITEEQAKLLLS